MKDIFLLLIFLYFYTFSAIFSFVSSKILEIYNFIDICPLFYNFILQFYDIDKMSTPAKPTLYSFYRSSCSWRVRIALAYKNIDYVYKPINLLRGEQHSDYLSVSPTGYVPCLSVADGFINESVAILDYLEEAYPDRPRLLPTDPFSRAKVRSILHQICCGIQPLQNLSRVSGTRYTLGLTTDVTDKWAHETNSKGFAALEQTLRTTAGLCCVGDELTQADCCLVPQVLNAVRFKVDLSLYPTISRVHQYVSQMQAIKDTHPAVMADCPEENRACVWPQKS